MAVTRKIKVFDIRSGFPLRLKADTGRTRSFKPEFYWWSIVSSPPMGRGPVHKPSLDSHDFHELIYTAKGTGHVDIGRQSYQAKQGDLFVVNPQDRHRNYPGKSGEFVHHYFAFRCSASWKQVLAQTTGLPAFPNKITGSSKFVRELLEGIKNEIEQRQRFRDLVISHCIDTFLLKLTRMLASPPKAGLVQQRPQPRISDRVKRSVSYPFQGKVSVEQMAHQCYLSRAYFSKVFKKETGESPARYVLRQKVELAKHMLSSSTDTVKQIAASLGFEDEFYFSRVFKRFEGVSPARYRSMIRPS